MSLGLGLVLTAWLSVPALAVTVTSSVDRSSLEVGDTLTVNVVGTRVTGESDFLGAAVEIPDGWRRGGQSVISPSTIADTTVKQWRFQFVPTAPGSSTVIPIVIVGTEISLAAEVDSIRGRPILVSVIPASVPPIWPWFLAGAIIVVATLAIVVRILRQRREATYQRPVDPPLVEALKVLEAIRANRREDRGRQYLVDVERVIHGYVSRRLGIRLTGMTATEIGMAVAPRCTDNDAVDALTALLKRCGETKFGGAHLSYDTLTGIEGQARSVLERLDANWV